MPLASLADAFQVLQRPGLLQRKHPSLRPPQTSQVRPAPKRLSKLMRHRPYIPTRAHRHPKASPITLQPLDAELVNMDRLRRKLNRLAFARQLVSRLAADLL